MARDTNIQQNEQPTRKSADQPPAGDQGDRERSIRTDRESGRSGGVTRRSTTTPVYGSTANPFVMMRRMAEDMDRLFGNIGFGRTGLGLAPLFNAEQSAWAPQVETFRRGDQLVVRADLPGMKKDDVNVEVDDGVLTISGERCDEHEEKRDDSYRTERTYGQFYRAIPLPEGASDEQCDASFKDGVLEVTIPVPKDPDRKAKRIQVR